MSGILLPTVVFAATILKTPLLRLHRQTARFVEGLCKEHGHLTLAGECIFVDPIDKVMVLTVGGWSILILNKGRNKFLFRRDHVVDAHGRFLCATVLGVPGDRRLDRGWDGAGKGLPLKENL